MIFTSNSLEIDAWVKEKKAAWETWDVKNKWTWNVIRDQPIKNPFLPATSNKIIINNSQKLYVLSYYKHIVVVIYITDIDTS